MKLYFITFIVAIYLSAIRGQYFARFGESSNSYDSNSLGSNDQSSRPASGSIVIPIGFTRHHPIEYVDYDAGEGAEEREPPVINVEGGNTPLNIIFNPRLSHLSVADSDDQSFRDSADEKYTYSEEEPIITYHEVNTPLFDQTSETYPSSYHDNQPNNQYINDDQKWQMSHQESQPHC